MKIKKNIGTADRIIRLVIAIAVLIYAYFEKSWWALILGLFVLFESLFSWCILYQILGKNSCPIKKDKD